MRRFAPGATPGLEFAAAAVRTGCAVAANPHTAVNIVFGIILNRGRLWTLGALVLLSGAGTAWFYQPDRQLERAWVEFLDTISARNASRLGRILAVDYTDRWGYSRPTLLQDARLAFFRFRHLEIGAEKVEIARHVDQATISAILRITADGSGPVQEARATVNALFTPFSFSWRREPGMFGSWRLVRFDHPELDVGRFRSPW